MAAITTAAAGLWSATGTWTGGTIPGNGDTVTLNHAVTLDDARTVGVSPAAGAGTNAIRCNSPLTIAAGGVLTCRGDIGLNNVPLFLTAGAVLEFDASQAGTPSTARYRCFGINASDPAAIVTIIGTSGSRVTVRSNAGGANGRFTDNGNDRSGCVSAVYCDFLRIGDSANAAFTFILQSADQFNMANCTLDACGSIGDAGGVTNNANARLSLSRVRMTNSVDNCLGLPFDPKGATGVRLVEFCDFDQSCLFYQGGGYVVTDTIFRSGYDITGSVPFAVAERLVLAFPVGFDDLLVSGTFRDCYCVRIGAPTNPHYLTTGDNTDRITGCVFDCPDGTGGQASGDCITFNNPAAARTIRVDHNIFLHVGNQGIGTMLSCLGGANLTVIAEHNTFHGSVGLYLGETYSGHAGMVASVKSNLSYHKTASTGFVISAEAAIVQDVVLSGNVLKNGKWNPNGSGYSGNLSFSSGSPGAGDVSGDPSFVDVDRNIKTWDTSLGGPGTVANALDAIGTGARTVQALLDYIRAGFQPGAAALQAAHDSVAPSSGWIGAVAGVMTVEQEGFRGRNDDGSETTATWKAAQDTNFTAAAGQNARIRALLNATNAPVENLVTLMYAEPGSSAYKKVPADCDRHT